MGTALLQKNVMFGNKHVLSIILFERDSQNVSLIAKYVKNTIISPGSFVQRALRIKHLFTKIFIKNLQQKSLT